MEILVAVFLLLTPVTAPAAALNPADLSRACVNESSAKELAASRRLRDHAPEDLTGIAEQYPRALRVAPMVLVARGEPAAALREYGAILERLPEEADWARHALVELENGLAGSRDKPSRACPVNGMEVTR